MKQRVILMLVVLSLVLSACATPQTAQKTFTPTPATAAPAATVTPGTLDTNTANCTAAADSVFPTPDPTQAVLATGIPAPSDTDWTQGKKGAPVVIVEYADFQCPACSVMSPVLKRLVAEFPNDIYVVYRHFPLPFHDKALLGSQAAEAAGLQGKFWEMHDRLFETQNEWSTMTVADFEPYLEKTAGTVGLDVKKFMTDLKSDTIVKLVAAAQKTAEDAQIPYTPFLMINNKVLQWPGDYDNLKTVVNLLLLEKKQFKGCPAMTIDTKKQYTATLETSKGKVVIELYADKAPLAVNSFIFLATNGWYDNVVFHRVIPGFVAQAGDPSGSGFGGPGYYFKNEINELKFDKAGVLGMANAGPDSNGSQFFITYDAAANLDGGYTIFGQVIEGMDVVNNLTPRDPTQAGQPDGDKILHITISEK